MINYIIINFVVYPEWLSDQGENMQFLLACLAAFKF